MPGATFLPHDCQDEWGINGDGFSEVSLDELDSELQKYFDNYLRQDDLFQDWFYREFQNSMPQELDPEVIDLLGVYSLFADYCKLMNSSQDLSYEEEAILATSVLQRSRKIFQWVMKRAQDNTARYLSDRELEVFTIGCLINARVLIQRLDEESLLKAIRILDCGILFGRSTSNSCCFTAVNLCIDKLNEIKTPEPDARTLLRCDGQTGDEIDTDDEERIIRMKPVFAPLIKDDIPSEDFPSLETFLTTYFLKNEPVKLLGCMQHWPALVKWKYLGYLNRRVGCRTVPVEMGDYARGGSTRFITLGEYLEEVHSGASVEKCGYMAQHRLLDQEIELMSDIIVPDYCAISDNDDVTINIWLGPAKTFSSLHFDKPQNILSQVIGRKRITLYSPEDSLFLYPRNGEYSNISMVDVKNPDLEAFPDFSKASPLTCILEPGEQLFIPSGWWHAVESLDISIVLVPRLFLRDVTPSMLLRYFFVGQTRLIGLPDCLKPFSSLKSIINKQFKMYSTIERGAPYTTDYRVFISNDSGPISPLHDIPLIANAAEKLYNMVVEVPRWTNAKMEICLGESLNPIKQDVKKGNIRFVANCFPHHGYIWNYGALPQTWENPQHLDASTGCKGDNDPIDVLEIGSRVAKRGEVVSVKILGCVALIDEGETDWKILAIDSRDPIASQVNDVADVETHFPGLLKATVEWFKIYKIPDGKPENQFAFNGEAKPRDFAVRVVDEVHEFWKALIKGEVANTDISTTNVTIAGTSKLISTSDALDVVNAAAAPAAAAQLDESVDKWHFFDSKL